MSNYDGTQAVPPKPVSTTNTKPNRLPAPTLFVGPPSHNASQLSISRTNTHDSTFKPSRDPLSRQQSTLTRVHDTENDHADGSGDGETTKAAAHNAQLKKASEKSVEAKWKEMQSTLNEVELTAQNSTHVFGESHAKALDSLRLAQVELARAWARGNDDKNIESAMTGGEREDVPGLDLARFSAAGNVALPKRPRGDTETSASTALSDESARSDAPRDGRNRLEDETAQDIRLATERRAANEAYFKKVDGSVRDVVAKLQLVAEAMRGVESESRSLWSASEGS